MTTPIINKLPPIITAGGLKIQYKSRHSCQAHICNKARVKALMHASVQSGSLMNPSAAPLMAPKGKMDKRKNRFTEYN